MITSLNDILHSIMFHIKGFFSAQWSCAVKFRISGRFWLNYNSVVLGQRLFEELGRHYFELGMTINKATNIENYFRLRSRGTGWALEESKGGWTAFEVNGC